MTIHSLVTKKPLQECERDATYSSDSAKGNAVHQNPPDTFHKSTDVPEDGAAGSRGASGVNYPVNDDAITCLLADDDMTIKQSDESLTTENAVSECEGDILNGVAEERPREGFQGQSAADGQTVPSIPGESELHQGTYSCDSTTESTVHRQPLAGLGKSTEGSQTALCPHSRTEAEKQTPLVVVDGKASNV